MNPELDLCRIPSRLVHEVAKKLKPREFVLFHRTCKDVHEVCHLHSNVIDLRVNNLFCETNGQITMLVLPYPAEKINLEEKVEELAVFTLKAKSLVTSLNFSAPLAGKIMELVRKLRLTIEKMVFAKPISCPGQDLYYILETAKVRNVCVFSNITKGLVPPAAFNKIQSLEIMLCDFTDGDLLNLKAGWLDLSSLAITASGLNQFLRQWHTGERGLEFISLQTAPLRVEDVVRDLPVSLLYNLDSHADSIIGYKPVGDRNLLGKSFYVMMKPETMESYVLCIGRESVTIQLTTNPARYLANYRSNAY